MPNPSCLQDPNHSLHWAHPLVRDWFITKFGSPTEPQEKGWPAILSGKTTLICAPTGSGKTFAAFLACLDGLIRKAVSHSLLDQTEILYISPLKALGNDIQKNLLGPLHEIAAFAKKHGHDMSEIRVAVRSGDTLAKERQAMLKKPPHILVTTPESLYLLLTAEKSRPMLQHIKTVIVDEIHALANDKRGAHLSLSLERLQALCPRPLLRIGLSATQKPITTIADFLTGTGRRKAFIVDIGHKRKLDLAVEIPTTGLGSIVSNEMWDEIYDRLAALSKEYRSTLIFVNTRRLAERVAHHLTERLGEEQVATHHGSLSKKLRLQAETRLKHGELKVLVATASLELGIDIGTVDLVCQISSPRSIATTLQRIGRAGHWRGAVPRGRLFASTRDELLECAALVYAIRQGDLDQLIMPEQPMDILAQQIVATCATGDWREEDLFQLVKQAYPYRHLLRTDYDAIITMLAEGIAVPRGRYGVYLFRDRINGMIKARRGSRLIAITNGGAIPENGLFTVLAEPTNTMVGTLDEDFAIESQRGDIILLGTTSWKINRIESASGRVLVEDAHGAPPTVPFWRGEAPARTVELSSYLSDLREKINALLPREIEAGDATRHPDVIHAANWLQQQCGLNESAAHQLIKYILQGRAVLGTVPSQKTIIAERFFDEAGGMQLVIHAPFGARITKAWGLALRKRFCRSFNFELQAAATDDGIHIALSEQHSFPLKDVFAFLHPHSINNVLTQAVLASPLFNTRWRWDAVRALALVRFRFGKKIPPYILRIMADDLLAAVFPEAAACQDNLAGQDRVLPEHPLVNETMKDVLTQALDLVGLTSLLQKINNGEVQCIAVDTPIPSPFAHEILNANPYAFLDDAPLEERRTRAVELRRMLPDTILSEIGKLDAAAISEVQHQAWPDVRNADELHDALQTLIALPADFALSEHQQCFADWHDYFTQLMTENRVGIAFVGQREYWFAAEKSQTFVAIYSDVVVIKPSPSLETHRPQREAAIETMLRGWMLHLGPTHSQQLSQILSVDVSDIQHALLKLETSGLILRGNFSGDKEAESLPEWCERRLLARIHRLTIEHLRKEIKPVSSALFMNWLLTWQHVTPGNQLRGEQGVLAIIRQLQGFELPANAWEKHILAKRIIDYHPDMLDQLCLSGTIGWGRLSSNKNRAMATSIVPITFFVREDMDWAPTPKSIEDETITGLSHAANQIYTYLKQRGASFFADIVRGSGKLKAEVEMGLWELVAAGMITADGFDNLRAFIDPRRRLIHKRQKQGLQRHPAGRWSLLHTENQIDHDKHLEAACWLLLKRYGIVFRDLLGREKLLPPWRELIRRFRLLEDRGEIRGGRFVQGFLGEQFALPYAVSSLRAMREKKTEGKSISLAGVDPLNLIGNIVPGERVPAISGKVLTLDY